MEYIDLKIRKYDKTSSEEGHTGVIHGWIRGPSLSKRRISIGRVEFERVVNESGGIYKVSSINKSILVTVDNIYINTLSAHVESFSLLELPKDQKAEVEIPISYTGKPVGVRNGGLLKIKKNKIKLMGLPHNIPKNIEIDISELDIGEKILVSEVLTSTNITISESMNETIVKCLQMRPLIKDNNESEVLVSQIKS